MTTICKYIEFFKLDSFGYILQVIIFIVLFASCSTEKDPEVSFANDITPIINKKCMECHISGRIPPYFDSGSYYRVLIEGGHIIPFDADKSSTYIKVKEKHSITSTLASEEMELLESWINKGALDN